MKRLLRALTVKLTLAVFTAQANLAGAVVVGPYLDLPNVPFYVGQSVPPNIMLTLDDSGSMMWAYVPDNFGGLYSVWSTGTAGVGSQIVAFKSSLNGLYYNPSVTYSPPVDANGIPYSTSFAQAWLNGFAQGQGSVNLAADYRPTQFYDSSRLNQYGFGSYLMTAHCSNAERLGSASAGYTCPGVGVGQNTPTRAYYWTYNVSATCPDQVPDGTWTPAVACFTFRSVPADQEQNFANWFSFYRTRNLAVVSAAISAFSNLPSDYRIAWQALNSCIGGSNSFSSSCRGWGTSRSTVDARIGSVPQTKKEALWSWMTRLPTYNGTPLRQALDRTGQYLQATGSMSPYADTIGSPDTSYASCRQSYAVVMTDGKWNGSGPYSTVGNLDNNSQTMPDGTVYSPAAPYRDGNSGNLADIAFKYWITDLQPSLPNTVRSYAPFSASSTSLTAAEYWDPRNDPAKWQHMTSFFVSLGMSRSLTSAPVWQGSTFAGSASSPYTGYYSVLNGGTAWPTTGDDAVGNVYDMWHAAINSRGSFFSVETPDALVEAFRQIRNRISDQSGAATSVAQTSLQVQSDSMAYAASYNTTKWDGTLRAYRVNSDGSTQATPEWTTDSTFNYLGTGYAGNNRILVKGSSGSLITFNAANLVNLAPAHKTSLDSTATSLGVTTAQMVNWILGDNSNPNLRSRDRLLGDVLASQPVFEGGRDYGYVETMWPSKADGTRIDGVIYGNYVKSKAPGGTRYKPTVYFGANDGMLHAFNGENGSRRFSYIPSVLLSKIGKRADPGYIHDYYVDGPIAVHDVHNGTEWRTILIGSLGAGGKGAYALDVTDPDSPQLLWEFFPSADTDLGHILGEPVIARASNGTWVVAFGNGYGSNSNRAVFYVIDALSGAQLKKIVAAESGAPAATSAHGLSAPALLYLAGRQLAFAYAGDWQGNLWRFDIGDVNPANWTLGFNAKPLFKARSASGAIQRITAKPRVISDRILGRVIVFGTGKMLELVDKDDLTVQSLYGIYDRASGNSALRGDLTQQTILTQTSSTRTTSANTLTKTAGWYIDLAPGGTGAGERVLGPVTYVPELSVIMASTVQPAGGACDSTMSSAVMAMSPFSGSANSLFKLASGGTTSGVMINGTVSNPSVVRKGGTLTVMINRGQSGIERLAVARGWNPRAAWRQLQ
ncbi:MAG TPA: PilC/PilY family type IV pilus protein [Burkholderiaceae bacterium]|nr:PilC/PilY family type IV pilus protein [Burkholderiaceae bacterium]